MSEQKNLSRYSTVAICLHWLTALVILALMAIGIAMVNLEFGLATKFQLYQLHKSLGVCVVVLTIFRLFWRLTHRVPALPIHMKRWEKGLAHFSHGCFYVLLIVLPLSGWARVSGATFNIETQIFGILTLPHISFLESLPPETKKLLEPNAQFAHFALALFMAALLFLHIAGALKHQFVDKQDGLARMWPKAKSE